MRVRFRFRTCERYPSPVLRSLPLRSSVLREPKRGNESRARTCERRAGDGWVRSLVPDCEGWVVVVDEGGGVPYLAVIPPWDEEMMVPFAVVGVVAAPRFERGTYGVYVVCIPGCFGGGSNALLFPEDGGAERRGEMGGVIGSGVGVECAADAEVGTMGAGTTSGQSRHISAIATAPPDELILIAVVGT